MNLRGGLALIKNTWLSWLQYRGFFFVLAFGWMIPPLVALFAWSAAAADAPVGGLSRGEFTAYYLILVLVNQITYSQSNWTLGDVIREGSLNYWLLKPMPAVYNVLASEGAGKVVYLVFVIPVALLLALLLKPELHTTPAQVLLGLAALFLAWLLRFLWGYWLAQLAFWASRSDALLVVQDSLVYLLSGVMAPLSLLPVPLQVLARILPFRYMVGFPVEVVVQPLPLPEVLAGFAIQAGWIILAGLLSVILWKNGLHRYSAVGG